GAIHLGAPRSAPRAQREENPHQRGLVDPRGHFLLLESAVDELARMVLGQRAPGLQRPRSIFGLRRTAHVTTGVRRPTPAGPPRQSGGGASPMSIGVERTSFRSMAPGGAISR